MNPTAAPAHFPYNHRNLEQVEQDRLRDIRADILRDLQEKMMGDRFNVAQLGPLPDWKAKPQFVHREPCPKCGVRADVGCAHTRRAA